MTEFLNASTFFCVSLTLIAFCAASALQRKWKLAVLNPILLSAAAVMAMLKVLGISNEAYQAGCQILSFLLTPATICLSISFYEQFRNLKKHLAAVAAGVIAGNGAPVTHDLLLDVFGLKRLLQQRIVQQIQLTGGQEIGSSPPGVQLLQHGFRYHRVSSFYDQRC